MDPIFVNKLEKNIYRQNFDIIKNIIKNIIDEYIKSNDIYNLFKYLVEQYIFIIYNISFNNRNLISNSRIMLLKNPVKLSNKLMIKTNNYLKIIEYILFNYEYRYIDIKEFIVTYGDARLLKLFF